MIRKTMLMAGAAMLAPTGPAAQAQSASQRERAALAAGTASPITARERQQGSEAHPGILSEFGGPYNGSQAPYATKVGQKIAVQSGLASSPGAFDVTLLNSAINNAFAIPGGYVYVTRQLMALMNDEAELAAVLGHEVAHVAARHSAKRQNTATRNSILGVLGQVLVGAVAGDSQIGGLLNRGIGTGTQLLTLGYSRGQETEADDLGVRYLARAGYDPMALSTMLRSLAAQTTLDQQIAGDAKTVPAWASTHPDPGARVQRAAQQATATGIRNGIRNRDGFLTAIDGMMYGEDPRQGFIDGREFLYPPERIAFTIPQGFTMQNGADAVSIQGTGGQAQFSTAAFNGNMEEYIGGVLRGISGSGGTAPSFTVSRTTVNGMSAAYTQVRANSGSGQLDVTVFAYTPAAGKAFHFVTLTPAGSGLGAFSSMVQSFRRITAAQAAAVKPRFVRVVTVKAGDTQASLAGRMAFTDYRLQRFQVLNGLSANQKLTPGQRVKIVTY
ncbi:M48 family metalloprotease [Sphingobium aquiterrae]|uniref:M48 family metalloprotease n=1 Tax=Sphingobium aquiterrae TaxID=2038656 RepID=UPI00301785F5